MNVKFLLPRHQRFPKPETHKLPLDMFGADAVERWFTQNEVDEFVKFTKRLAV